VAGHRPLPSHWRKQVHRAEAGIIRAIGIGNVVVGVGVERFLVARRRDLPVVRAQFR
jgi:uncharacterized protein YjeT (DUF2065 family)